MKILQVWIEHPVRSLDKTFTYLSEEEVFPGCRVEVPFGAKTLVGFVDQVENTDENQAQIEARLGFKVKKVLSVMDKRPLITEELRQLAQYMHDTTLSVMIACYQAMLPAKVKPASGKDKKILMEKWVKVSGQSVSLTPKQAQAYAFVIAHQQVRYSELRASFPSQAKSLLDKGALVSFEMEKSADNKIQKPVPFAGTLSDDQKNALKEINDSEDPVYLIRGVTGSGKTEVYLHLAQDALEKGKQVLILVPEISLTPQMINRVSARFGKDLAIYHSGLNNQEKYEQYRKVVMDEEHDSSYKQENQPCYHCRDIAIWRGRYHHCKVILGSATPSLESYARGMKNVYHLILMKHRINDSLPQVTIVNMAESMRHNGSYILSEELKAKIHDRLQKKEQVILLLNRRGYHTQLRCRSCGTTLLCPHCDIALSWHNDVRKLRCHTCGYESYLPKVCPKCGSNKGFASFGFGTEKLEQEVQTCFPGVKTLRMDADTTTKKDAHAKILEAFGKGEADILLGTQMIAKGLDYPHVTLVGVINGDAGLARTDFRSCETTFQLLMQAGGRSGRGENAGEVVYQVYDPDHYAVQCAAAQDYETFFRYEMQFRHLGKYPPYTYLIALTVSDSDQRYVERTADALKKGIQGNFKTIGVISLLKLQDLYRSRIVLKGTNLDDMRQAVLTFMHSTKPDMKGLRIDVNPMVLD